MRADDAHHHPRPPDDRRAEATADRYQTVVDLLWEIINRLQTIEADVDGLDRRLRPFGDGTKQYGRGRRR